MEEEKVKIKEERQVMRRDSLVQSIGCHNYGRIVHEVFCFSPDTVFVFEKTLKKFCSSKLGQYQLLTGALCLLKTIVLPYSWETCLLVAANLCILSFAAQAAITNTWNTLGHSYPVHERILYCVTLFSMSLCLIVFPLHMLCS